MFVFISFFENTEDKKSISGIYVTTGNYGAFSGSRLLKYRMWIRAAVTKLGNTGRVCWERRELYLEAPKVEISSRQRKCAKGWGDFSAGNGIKTAVHSFLGLTFPLRDALYFIVTG